MGHIRKLRFAGILGIGLLATSGMGTSMAKNGISANLALSNTIFTQQVGGLDGDGFALFVDEEDTKEGGVPVSRLRINDATVKDMCMSAPIKLPGVGDKKFQMIVPGEGTVASNQVIGAKDLSGALTQTKPQIGVDATLLDDDAVPGSGGIASQRVEASDQTIHATSISADKLTAKGGKISIVDRAEGDC